MDYEIQQTLKHPIKETQEFHIWSANWLIYESLNEKATLEIPTHISIETWYQWRAIVNNPNIGNSSNENKTKIFYIFWNLKNTTIDALLSV